MIMHKPFNYVMVLVFGLSGALTVQAQSSSSGAGSSNYSGFGTTALSNTTVTPFRSTTQDLNAVLEGNALVSQGAVLQNYISNPSAASTSGYMAPYIMTTVSGSSSSAPLLAMPSLALQTLTTTMGLAPTLSGSFANSQYIINQTVANAQANYSVGNTTNSAMSIMEETPAQAQAAAASTPSGIYMTGSNSNLLTGNMSALAAYNAQTIMYPNVNNYKSIATSQAQGSKVQQYLGLVTGSTAPPSGMMVSTQFGGSNATQNFNTYQLMVTREAAVQTAAAEVLQQFALNNAPLSIEASALGDAFVSTKMVPSINTVEQFMASRRLSPNSGWYYRVAQGSALELQRESLYLQAENLYEMNQVHQELQKQSMLLSMMLIEQTRSSISMLNQANQVTAAQMGTSSSTVTSSTSSVPMATSSTSTTSTSS